MGATLTDYIVASFSCIGLETVDYDMAIKKIRDSLIEADEDGRFDETGKQIDQKFHVWTNTEGMVTRNRETGEMIARVPTTLTIEQTLDFVIKQATAHAVVLVNPQRYWINHNLPTTAKIIQLIIDAALAARRKFSNIFLVGPELDLPTELQTVVHFVDFALPTAEELVDICVDRVLLPNIEGLPGVKVPNLEKIVNIKEAAQFVRKENQEILDDAARAAAGLDSFSAENAFSLAITLTGGLDTEIIQNQKRQFVKNTDVLGFIMNADTMNDIGGFGNLKKWVSKRNKAFTDEAKAFGVTPPKGILLVGSPGQGKSLAAKATASALDVPLLRFDMSKVFDRYVGNSESKMRTALRVAEAIAPCVLFLDEIEKAIAGSRSGGDSGVAARVLGQFLQWRQETTAPVFICCTCNDISAIPPEFYRPGRVDAIFATTLPDYEERIEIFEIHLRKRKKEKDTEKIDLNLLSLESEGYSGAEIEQAVVEAVFEAFNKDQGLVTTKQISKALSQIRPQSKRNSAELKTVEEWANEHATPVSIKKERVEEDSKVRRLGRRKSN